MKGQSKTLHQIRILLRRIINTRITRIRISDVIVEGPIQETLPSIKRPDIQDNNNKVFNAQV